MNADSAGRGDLAAAYQPPTLVVLGSVAALTLGANGSIADNNGRSSHGKLKPNQL